MAATIRREEVNAIKGIVIGGVVITAMVLSACAGRPGPAASSPRPAAEPTGLTCATVVDSPTGMTARQVIYALRAPHNTINGLGAAARDLENYHGSKLAADANQFAVDMGARGASQGYLQNPGDSAYVAAVARDVAALDADCPTPPTG